MKRLSSEKRAQLEARHKNLLTAIAAMEPGKVSGIVDSVSTENPDIKDVVEKIMKIMDAEPEVAKYHTASKSKFARFFKKAFEMLTKEDESPEEEAHDLTDPAMHIFEDAEHEAQTMDDPTLVKEVQKLEDHVKHILDKHDESRKDAPHGEHPVGPLHKMHGDSEAKDGKSTMDSPEHKLAKLKSLPKQQRLEKAAKLRALAGVLEDVEKEVSQDNSIDKEPENSALMNDYKDQEDGSMKDVQAAKKDIKTLLAALDDMEKDEKSEKEDNKEDDKKTALLRVALKHLYASIEDMEEKEDDKEDKNDKEDMKKEARDLDESEGGKPNWLQEKQEEAEKKEDKKDELTEKQARIRSILQKNLQKQATVDGKKMSTPKEVPSPEGTTEDNLKGDAEIQYSKNSGADGQEIFTKRMHDEKDAQVLGNDEPNAVYYSNSAGKERYEPTMSDDSSKDVTNKRVLNDGESAVQKSVPASPDEGMEKGEGTHTKTLDWSSEKAKADMTPSGPRLVGLAEMNEQIKIRTARASQLAAKMYELGLIRTEAQFAEEIGKLASLDDDGFRVASSLLGDKTASKRIVAEEKMKHHDDDGDYDGDDEEDEKMEKEARLQKRASRRNSSDKGDVRFLKSVANNNQGLRRPLVLESDSNYASGKSDIHNKIAQAFEGQWTDPVKVANQKLSILDAHVKGPIDLTNFVNND